MSAQLLPWCPTCDGYTTSWFVSGSEVRCQICNAEVQTVATLRAELDRVRNVGLDLIDQREEAKDRASNAVVALAQYQERIRRYQARLQSLVDTGSAEAAVHAERALGMLGEELRK